MSIFKKDEAVSNGALKDAGAFQVLKTGGEVDAIIAALLPHSLDKEPAVRSAFDFALVDLGNRQPALTLSALVAFLHRNPSLPPPHRIQLLSAVDKVISMQRDHLSPALADDLIRFLTREMIKDVEPINELAQPCSSALVSLSVPFCPPLLTELLSHFKHGDLPHYYLVKTLSDVAVANPTSFTLRLSDTLTRTTPSLSMVKKPPLRWVFATALGHYADALHHFTVNASEEERAAAAINPKSFELEFLSSFDILFNRWLAESGEVKVRMAIVEALGSMSQVLGREALEQRLGKVIGKGLEMYKKEKVSDHLPISQGLYALVAEACKTSAIEPLLPLLLSSLHPLICRPIDPTSPLTAKNHNEQLRIIETIARADLEPTLAFIVGRFQLKEKEVRVGSLVVLRHLVNSMDALMVDKRPLVMSAVLTMVGEQDLQVKKAIMQLIVSMSNQGYLAMEGGQALIKFILQQCALPVDEATAAAKEGKGGAVDEASPLQIRNAGNHIVYVMATKVPSSRPVMWPYLLELLNDEAYSRAILVLLRCIDALATKAREEGAEDYQVDFALKQDIPRPQAILARLVSLLAEPYRKDIGQVVCRVMLALGPIIHPAIGAYWDEAVPALLDYLDQHQGEATVWKWQDAVLKLWKETVNRVAEQKWLQDTVDALLAQFRLYTLRPAKPDHPALHESTIHRQIHRYVGYALSRIEARSIVERCIESLYTTVNHRVDSERVGFAQGMGLCAHTHIDVVLGRLSERVGRKEKKGGFFANLLKDDEGIGDECALSTIVLSYGYVAAYAQPELLLSRIDVYILHNLLPLMPKARTHLFRITAVTALDLLGKAVLTERLPEGKKNFRLTQRDEVIQQLVAYLDDRARKDVRVSGEMRAYGLVTVSTLLHLQPPLSAELRSKLLLAVLPYFALTDAQLTDDNKDRRKEDEGLDTRERREEPTPHSIQAHLNSLLATLVRCDPQLSTVLDSVKLLEAYIVSVRVVERQRASASFLVLLKEFVRGCVREGEGEGRVRHEERGVPLLGSYVSMVLPRVLDSDVEVRGASVENVQALLYVHQLLGNPDQPKPSAEVKLLSECKAKVERQPMAERMEGGDDLAGVLVTLLPVAEVSRCLNGLFTAFIDADPDAALGAAYFWQRIIHLQGKALASDLKMLVGGELVTTRQMKAREVLEVVYGGLRQLATLHFAPVIGQLLDTQVPLSKEYVDAYAALVAEPSTPLPLQVIDHLCALLNDTPIDKDKPPPVVATSTAALRDVFSRVDSLRPLLQSHFAPVVCSLLMRVGMCQDVDAAGTADAIAALRAFFTCAGDGAVVGELDATDVWKGLATPHYDDSITLICRSLCTHHPAELKPAILAYLGKFFSQHSYTGQRIVATAVLAELVTHSADSGPLLRDVIKTLLPRVADKVCKVRKHALRGLGNLVGVWNEETAEMATSILSSLISASEDGDAEVAGEAVASLTRIVGVVSEGTVAPMLISICFRLRPAFERKEENVRASAFTLFGALCRFGGGGAGGTTEGGGEVGGSADFLDHVHTNLPIFIIHLLDESGTVRQACQAGLRAVAALLDPTFAALVNDSACDPAGYDELVYKAAPMLAGVYPQHVRGYIDTSVAYFGSKWVELRGAGALLSCCLLANASEAVRKSITVSALVTALIKLLEEPSAGVRAKAVKGLAYLHDV